MKRGKSKISHNLATKELTAIQEHVANRLQILANKIREDIVIPVCKKYQLDYKSGNGITCFYGRNEEGEFSIGSADEAKREADGRYEELASVFEDYLDLETSFQNDCVGYHIEDVSEMP